MARGTGEVRRARRSATAISALMMAAKKHHAEANAPCLMIRVVKSATRMARPMVLASGRVEFRNGTTIGTV